MTEAKKVKFLLPLKNPRKEFFSEPRYVSNNRRANRES